MFLLIIMLTVTIVFIVTVCGQGAVAVFKYNVRFGISDVSSSKKRAVVFVHIRLFVFFCILKTTRVFLCRFHCIRVIIDTLFPTIFLHHIFFILVFLVNGCCNNCFLYFHFCFFFCFFLRQRRSITCSCRIHYFNICLVALSWLTHLLGVVVVVPRKYGSTIFLLATTKLGGASSFEPVVFCGAVLSSSVCFFAPIFLEWWWWCLENMGAPFFF
mmetsp:Transcript_31580/g.48001  ORF Transcript_31580/g.48001 Transcript_31580/m.48001 type:complete len:214 (-) Transcript_31580:100-741(-)